MFTLFYIYQWGAWQIVLVLYHCCKCCIFRGCSWSEAHSVNFMSMHVSFVNQLMQMNHVETLCAGSGNGVVLIENSYWLPFHFPPFTQWMLLHFSQLSGRNEGVRVGFQRIIQEGHELFSWDELLPWSSNSWFLRLHNDARTQHKCQVQASDAIIANHAWARNFSSSLIPRCTATAYYTAELISRSNAMQCKYVYVKCVDLF
jgi:hypothetical protein